MKRRKDFFNFFLWWSVIGVSIWVGGTVYMMSVIDPQWSQNPPESLRSFLGQTDFNKYIWNFFGPPFMVLRSLLPVVLALIFGWNSRRHRRYLSITLSITVILIIFTLVYIYPINNELFFKAGGDLSPHAIQTLVKHWIIADRLRFAVYLVGYFFLLKAFRLPYTPESTSQ